MQLQLIYILKNKFKKKRVVLIFFFYKKSTCNLKNFISFNLDLTFRKRFELLYCTVIKVILITSVY